MPQGRGSRRRGRGQLLNNERGARRRDFSVWGVDELPSQPEMVAVAQEHGVAVEEVEAVVSLAWIDGAEAEHGETCPGPIVVHADGVMECCTCWKIAGAHHGERALARCDHVAAGLPGWSCDRCR